MKLDTKEAELLRILDNIIEFPPVMNAWCGLCMIVSLRSELSSRMSPESILAKFWNDFEYYSGDDGFPISDDKEKNPQVAYRNNREHRWDLNHEHGRRRWKLVYHIRNKLIEKQNAAPHN